MFNCSLCKVWLSFVDWYKKCNFKHWKLTLYEVSKKAKIRNRYNQISHLIQDTIGKVTSHKKTSHPANSFPENVVGYILMFFLECFSIMEANNMNHDQTTPKEHGSILYIL